ncbi:MAG: hypothetical protein ISQ32_04625 [Rickettsiales bacterium]|nr:hypothetical protein [Rickettsiales bacterium]
MKKILLITSSVVAISTFVSSANAKSVSDIFFKPSSGQVVSTTDYAMFTITRDNDAGVSQDTDGTSVSQKFDYGLSDKDTLSLSIGYGDLDDNANSEYNNQNGFTNPTLGFKRRIASDEVIVDLKFAYTPDLIDEDDSDFVSEKSAFDFGVNVGGESFVGDYLIVANVTQVTSDSDGNEAYSVFTYGVEKQIELTDQIKLHPAFYLVESDGTDNTDDFKDTGYNYFSYGASISYDVNDDLAVYLGIRNRNYDESGHDDTATTLTIKTDF